MGLVFRAEHTRLGRPVAIKLLGQALSASAEGRQLLRLEARAAARVRHPNVVVTHALDRHGGVCYLVMELVEGASAQALLEAHGPAPWAEATRVVAGACRGLAAAHAAGVLHCDVKPGNILLARDGTAKLADFGLARPLGAPGPGVARPGQVLGTPTYMSPEQCRAEPADERSDVYALGATYYALLVGRPPFAAAGPLGLAFAHCARPAPDPRSADPGIPEGCAAVVRRSLAKEPADRYPSAGAMLQALERLLAQVGPGATPARPAGP
jgi:serine/threonine protein kinase